MDGRHPRLLLRCLLRTSRKLHVRQRLFLIIQVYQFLRNIFILKFLELLLLCLARFRFRRFVSGGFFTGIFRSSGFTARTCARTFICCRCRWSLPGPAPLPPGSANR